MTSIRMRRVSALAVFLGLALALGNAGAAHAQAQALAAPQRLAVIDEVSALLNKHYVFADTAKKMEDLIRKRLTAGEYDKFAGPGEFAQAIFQDLASVSKDKHLRFVHNPEQAAFMASLNSRNADEVRKAREREEAMERRENYGFRKVERLAGNVGYLDFRVFASPGQAGPTAIAAMNFLAHCDAVIVDLRQNGGGDPAQIQLICSYFFAEPAHLNDIYTRSTDRTEHYWTLPYVPGPKPVGADLYILTSRNTFSGAEEFSYNMKNLKRGTIVGETTGGGAHPTDAMIVQKDYILRVPIARAINPVTKTNWEGTGVAPDVSVPAAEAFDRAYQMALEKLAGKASDPDGKREFEWILTKLRARRAPVRLDEKTLKRYVGVYDPDRKVVLEEGGLTYQWTGPTAALRAGTQPKYRLVPLTETLFEVEGLDYFRIEFTVKDGKAVELVGLYDNGERQPHPRTK